MRYTRNQFIEFTVAIEQAKRDLGMGDIHSVEVKINYTNPELEAKTAKAKTKNENTSKVE
jgi:hypothetical protein